jgi:hypothetical protein
VKKRSSNLLTVVLAAAVLLAGTGFGYYMLPYMTESGEQTVQRRDVRLTNPQEIVSNPQEPVAFRTLFPASLSYREHLEEAQQDEAVKEAKKSFLVMLSDYVDILFNLNVDASLIMESYTTVWRYDAPDGVQTARNTADLFTVDVIFTDPKSTRWRITAAGYADEVFHLSCIQQKAEEDTAPPCITQDTPTALLDLEGELLGAVNRFRSRVISIPVISGLVQTGLCEEFRHAVRDRDGDFVWVAYLESDGKLLICAVQKTSMTPLSYTFMNLEGEMPRYRQLVSLLMMAEESGSVTVR